jgi:hypothetical protein
MTKLSIDPSGVELRGKLGAAGPSAVFTVRNVGKVASAMIVPGFNGQDPGEFAVLSTTCTTLAPGASCPVTVALRATKLGSKNAAFAVTAGLGVSAYAGLMGLAYETSIDVLDGPTEFEQTRVGTRSQPLSIQVINLASQPATVAASTSSPEFVLAADTCTGRLATRGQCRIDVVFAPQSSGQKTGALVLSADSGDTRTVPLTGSAGAP